MATKKTNKKPATKSNVSKSSKKQAFRFRWWMAAIGIAIIAVVGIVIIRYSRASGATYDVTIDDATTARDKYYLKLYNQGNVVRGSITKFQTSGGGATPVVTQWRMTLNNGLVACGQLLTKNSKNIADPSLPTSAVWVVSNPNCIKG